MVSCFRVGDAFVEVRGGLLPVHMIRGRMRDMCAYDRWTYNVGTYNALQCGYDMCVTKTIPLFF